MTRPPSPPEGKGFVERHRRKHASEGVAEKASGDRRQLPGYREPVESAWGEPKNAPEGRTGEAPEERPDA